MARVFDQDGQFLGAADDTAATPRGYSYDPLGNPIPDPSGTMESGGFETAPADFGQVAVQSGVDAAASIAHGLKLILYGVAVIAGLVVVGEAQRLMPTLPAPIRRKRKARRKGRG